MLVQHIRLTKSAGLKIMVILLCWISLCTVVAMHYGLHFVAAITDAAFYSLLILLGFMLLENVFRFYLPTKRNVLLVFFLPFMIASLVVYAGDVFFNLLVPVNLKSIEYINNSFAIKALILLLIFTSYSLILNLQGNIEEQAKAEERALKMEQMTKEAELYQLRQQLQPHFLFNSLNSISALVEQQPVKAREMVLQLSDFLRGTIGKEANKWISVEEEINFLRLFTEIEKVRFGHRLIVEFSVAEGISKMKVPHLMIQPLVENAMKHGLYGLVDQVTIKIHFEKKSKNLHVVLTNPYDPKAGQAKGAGFGLEAVKRRLFLIFGRYDLLRTSSTQSQYSVDLFIPQLS